MRDKACRNMTSSVLFSFIPYGYRIDKTKAYFAGYIMRDVTAAATCRNECTVHAEDTKLSCPFS